MKHSLWFPLNPTQGRERPETEEVGEQTLIDNFDEVLSVSDDLVPLFENVLTPLQVLVIKKHAVIALDAIEQYIHNIALLKLRHRYQTKIVNTYLHEENINGH
jgi:hypothetical protein